MELKPTCIPEGLKISLTKEEVYLMKIENMRDWIKAWKDMDAKTFLKNNQQKSNG